MGQCHRSLTATKLQTTSNGMLRFNLLLAVSVLEAHIYTHARYFHAHGSAYLARSFGQGPWLSVSLLKVLKVCDASSTEIHGRSWQSNERRPACVLSDKIAMWGPLNSPADDKSLKI
eukprot:4611824-Pyramimonas_sp.AAC.1